MYTYTYLCESEIPWSWSYHMGLGIKPGVLWKSNQYCKPLTSNPMVSEKPSSCEAYEIAKS